MLSYLDNKLNRKEDRQEHLFKKKKKRQDSERGNPNK